MASREEILTMNDHDLLLESVLLQQKQAQLNRISHYIVIGCALIICIAMLIIIPKFLNTIEQINDLMNEAEVSLSKVNNLDFDSLNQSITDFSNVISKLSSFFGR